MTNMLVRLRNPTALGTRPAYQRWRHLLELQQEAGDSYEKSVLLKRHRLHMLHEMTRFIFKHYMDNLIVYNQNIVILKRFISSITTWLSRRQQIQNTPTAIEERAQWLMNRVMRKLVDNHVKRELAKRNLKSFLERSKRMGIKWKL